MVSLVPRSDPSQALRIRRFLMALGSYVMWTALVVYCVLAGSYRLSLQQAFTWLFPWVVVINAVLYVIFRTGLNRRFKDPSLTVPQMAAATVMVMVTLYFADAQTRGVLLLIYPVVFVFGFFRLQMRQFTLITALALTGYGAALWLLFVFHPETVSLRQEIFRFVILGVVLVWFSVVGSYVNRLREQVVRSNTELREALSTIERMAVHDPLSGVFNRRKLMEVLNEEKARAERGGPPFAICLIDMDQLKEVNDGYGHLQGDALLVALGQGIKRILRSVDCIARYGGDEFVVVLPQTDLAGALAFAERSIGATQVLAVPGMPAEFSIRVSIGVAVFRTGLSVETLIALADAAMYRAKRSGGNQVEAAH